MHGGGVGIVGIDNEVVLLGDNHLRAVVCGDIFLQSCTDFLSIHAKVDTNGDGSKKVVDVVGSNKLCLNLMPLGAATFLFKGHQWLSPTELQEGVAFDDLSRDTAVPVVRVSGVGSNPYFFIVPNLIHEVFVVCIDENETFFLCTKEIVEFAFGLDNAFKRTKALQMGPAYIGNQTTGGLCRFCQCLDVARMTGPHLDDSYLMLACQSEQCLGNTYVVIEVALSVEHIELL